jgi:hypothetical protein
VVIEQSFSWSLLLLTIQSFSLLLSFSPSLFANVACAVGWAESQRAIAPECWHYAKHALHPASRAPSSPIATKSGPTHPKSAKRSVGEYSYCVDSRKQGSGDHGSSDHGSACLSTTAGCREVERQREHPPAPMSHSTGRARCASRAEVRFPFLERTRDGDYGSGSLASTASSKQRVI